MKIQFDKIGSTPKPFKVMLEKVTLEGTLKKSGYGRVTLKGKLYGEVDLDCDRCGRSYLEDLNSELLLSLSNSVLKDKDDLDIIEFLDDEVDISYILESEINVLKSTYHSCTECSDNEESLEIEY